MNFSNYLKSFADDQTPFGDLARDFIDSKSKATTYRGVVQSMKKYHPCETAWMTLETLYNKYLKENIDKKIY